MTRVEQLVPGMKVIMPSGDQATFVAQTTHPLWPHLQLVVWRMPENWAPDVWSHDALDARQDVGAVVPCSSIERATNLRHALLPGARSVS